MNPALLAMIAAQVAARDKVTRHLREAGATSASTAVPLPEELQNDALRELRKSGIVAEAAPGRFHVDEHAVARVKQSEHRVVWNLLIGSVAVLVALLIILAIVRN